MAAPLEKSGFLARPSELVVLVDEHDREIGTASKLEAHRSGALHRAVSVFVFDDAGRLLLQRRAAGKYHSAGQWANTCCTHPRPGESNLAAAQRRLAEEMGIHCALTPATVFTYRCDVGNGFTEHEIDHVFVGRANGAASPDPAEVQDYRWTGLDELHRDMRAHPAEFAPWLAPAVAALERSPIRQ